MRSLDVFTNCRPTIDMITPIYDLSVYDEFMLEEFGSKDRESIARIWSRSQWLRLAEIYSGALENGFKDSYKDFLIAIMPYVFYHHMEQKNVRREIYQMTKPHHYHR